MVAVAAPVTRARRSLTTKIEPAPVPTLDTVRIRYGHDGHACAPTPHGIRAKGYRALYRKERGSATKVEPKRQSHPFDSRMERKSRKVGESGPRGRGAERDHTDLPSCYFSGKIHGGSPRARDCVRRDAVVVLRMRTCSLTSSQINASSYSRRH